jgi:hypothetical protein
MYLNILCIVLVIRKSTTVFFRSLYGTRRNQENLSYNFLLSLAKASIKGEEVAILSVLADGVEWGGASKVHTEWQRPLSGVNSILMEKFTEWQWPISGVHSIMMEKSALAGEGGGVHAHALSIYSPSST